MSDIVRWFIGAIAFAGTPIFALECQAGTLNATINTPNDSPLADTVVSLAPVGHPVTPAKPGTKAIMAQENKQFVPFVLPVQVGTTVEFPNHDSFRHQVYSFSAAKSFELKLYGAPEVGVQVFDKEGAVPLGCNIHDHMLAYIYVVGTPYFAKTDRDGKVSIPQVPAGAYLVKTWHPNGKANAEAQTVNISADGETNIKVQMELKRERRQRKAGAVDEHGY